MSTTFAWEWNGLSRSRDFKAYVFPVMFFKWISDSWDHEHAQALEDFGDALTEEIEADYPTFVIPHGCHWADVIETSQQTGVKLDAACNAFSRPTRMPLPVFLATSSGLTRIGSHNRP